MGVHDGNSVNIEVEETASLFSLFYLSFFWKKIDSSVISKVNYGKHIVS
jgi:hypothetical protein